MEGSKYHIVYVSRRAREDTVVRAAPASQGGPGDAANERQTGDLGNDIETLLKYNDGKQNRLVECFRVAWLTT